MRFLQPGVKNAEYCRCDHAQLQSRSDFSLVFGFGKGPIAERFIVSDRVIGRACTVATRARPWLT